MKKITGIILGIFYWVSAYACYAADKFDVLPDLPEPLASAAQASSVTTTDTVNTVATQSVGQEPNFISMIFSLVFITGILSAALKGDFAFDIPAFADLEYSEDYNNVENAADNILKEETESKIDAYIEDILLENEVTFDKISSDVNIE